MTHFDFARPSGQWSGEMVPGASDYQRWDVMQSQLLLGDTGGSYAPVSPIIIGGAGCLFDTAGTVFSGLTGSGFGVNTATGGRVVLSSATNFMPQLTSTTSDTFVLSCSDMIAPLADLTYTDPSGHLGSIPVSWLQDDFVAFATMPSTPGVQNVATGSESSYLPIPRRWLHQHAHFKTVKLTFRVTTPPPQTFSVPPLAFFISATNPASHSILTTITQPYATWTGSTTFTLGQYAAPTTVNATGYYYKVVQVFGAGESNTTEPIWPTTVGGVIADLHGVGNGVTWMCVGKGATLPATSNAQTYYNGGQPQVLEFDLDDLNATPAWQASTLYPSYSFVQPTTPNGYFYEWANNGAATSGATQPTWPTSVGSTVADGGVTWTCVGLTNANQIDIANNTYGLVVGGTVDVSGTTQPLVQIELLNVTFTVDGIVDLQFE